MYLQYSIAFENKQVKFYTITQPVAKSFVQMIMSEGFPLRDRINFKIRFVPHDFSNGTFGQFAHTHMSVHIVFCVLTGPRSSANVLEHRVFNDVEGTEKGHAHETHLPTN